MPWHRAALRTATRTAELTATGRWLGSETTTTYAAAVAAAWVATVTQPVLCL